MKLLLPFLLATSVISGELTLDEALFRAEKSSATLRSVETKLASLDSVSQYFTTGANPELEVGTENFGISEFEVVLSQELRFNSQKEPVRKELALIKRNAELTVESTRLELQREVIESYLEVALLQDGAELLDSITESLNRETEELDQRYKAGAASKLELLEQHELLIELKEERFALESEYRSALAALNSFSEERAEGDVESLQQLVSGFNSLDSSTVSENHPEYLELNVQQFEAEILSLESTASRTPGLSVSGGYKRNNEESANSLLLGFTMELPFNKEAKLAQLESEIISSSVELKRAEVTRKLNAELSSLNEAVTVSKERLRVLREERIPLALEKTETARTQFRHGNLPITEKIRYKRELIELQQQELDLLRKHLSALAELALFTGTFNK